MSTIPQHIFIGNGAGSDSGDCDDDANEDSGLSTSGGTEFVTSGDDDEVDDEFFIPTDCPIVDEVATMLDVLLSS